MTEIGVGFLAEIGSLHYTAHSDGKPFDLNNNHEGNLTAIPVYSCLIEHPDGLVLFDAGVSVYSYPPVPEEQTPLYCLRKLGVDPGDIRYAVCSHLHFDHSGYLKYLQNAKIIVHANEFNNIHNEMYDQKDVAEWTAAGLNWQPVSGRLEIKGLLPGIEIIALGPGHSFGMLALLVRLAGSGNIILAADAVYCRENVGPPVAPPGIIYDTGGYIKSLEFLLQTAKDNNAQIWYGHDMEQFNTLFQYGNGCYE